MDPSKIRRQDLPYDLGTLPDGIEVVIVDGDVIKVQDRKDFAKDLLALAKAKISTKPRSPQGLEADAALKGCIPWMQSGVELRALYLLALDAVEPAGAVNSELADWLMTARVGSRWIGNR